MVLYDQKGNKLDFQTNDCHSQTVGPIGQVPITSQKLPVFISHVVSPNEIYIQRKIDLEKAKILSQKLQDFYKEGAEHAKFEEKEGQLVAVKSVNSQTWYRGRVMGLLQDAVDVFYIDLGKRETLPHENVKNLDASFHDINSFVRKVCLDINCDFGALENVNAKLEALKHIELLGYFINDKGNFLSEFVLEGNRITPTLKFDNLDASNDKFEKILRVSKPLENETLKGLMRENEVENQSSCSLKVFVIHIDSPKQFWVHKESSVNDLSLFQEELKKACETLPNKQNPEIHDMVAALFCDMWYRAEVLNVENNMLTVKFIDYGNILEIDLSCESVKELPADFVGVPTFATKFSLKGNWKESATAKFEEIVFQFEDPVTAVILENKDPLVVDLLKDGQSIFETLIREGVGEINESKESDFCTVYLTHSNSPNDFYVQRDSSTDLLEKISGILSEVDTLEVVSTIEDNKIYAAKFLEYDSWFRAKVLRKNQKYVEVLFIDYGNVANVNELRRLPNELLEIPALGENYSLIYGKNCDNWSEEACEKFLEYVDGQELKMKVVVNRVQKPIVKLFSGETDISEELGNLCENDGRIEVYVSHVNSPTDFYIQHVNDDKFKLITKALESGSECEDLEERTPGTLCLAGFAGDGLWYRAKILRNCDDGCEVLFIDCGKTLISTELKKPLHDILEIPPRAMKCTLDLHVRNVPESVKEEFTNLTASGDKIFRARIITPGEVNVVSLKLDGRILEETLSSDSINEETENGFSASLNHPDLSSSLDDETDDDKNSKKTIIPENYVRENIEDDVRARSCLQNETDEEKRFKIAISTADGGSEGFKSDDEKGISTEVLSSFVNATDIELMEEFQKIEELSQVELNLPVESNGVANEVNQNSTDEFFESSKATETSESIAENSRKESNEEEEEEEEEKGKSTDEESKDKPIEQSDVSNVSESIDSAESPQKTASAEERPSDEYSEVKQSVPPVPADND